MMRAPLRSSGNRWIRFLAFGFGVGAAPVAPGTFGTLLAVPLYLALAGTEPLVYAAVVVAMFLGGVWLCRVAERDLGVHDHPAVVWDEIVGFLVTMFMAPPGWFWVIVGFTLFRLFDVWKPFPIRALEQRVHGGLGTMLDDVLAGGYALLVLQATAFLVVF